MGVCATSVAQTHAQNNGIFNLQGYDFIEQPSMPIDGKWPFYWEQLLSPQTTVNHPLPPDTVLDFTTLWNSVPAFSGQGYATYLARIILDKDHPPLALYIPDFYSSYALYINGRLFSNNGIVSNRKESYTPKWLPITKSLGYYDADTLNLVLQVANFDHSKGGAHEPIIIGEESALMRKAILGYGYSFILTGALLMGGMFFLGLYLFGRHETTIFYFSLFSIIYSYRIIGFGSYALHYILPELPWGLTIRMEYISLFLSGCLFGMYTLHLYPKETSKSLMYLLNGISVAFIAISLVTPPVIFTRLIIPYFIVLLFYLTIIFWIYIFAVVDKQPGAIYSLISSGVVFFVFVYGIFAYFGILKTSLLLNFIGYIFFFFFQSLVLSYRFADNLKTALAQAQESLKAKSQFLSTMSHEIRTPLNAVIGLSGLLSEGNLTEIQREFASTIKKSGESLLSLINNILDYSKIESGKIELEKTEFSLIETVELVLDVVSSINENPKLELLYTYDEQLPDFMIGDSTRLQQVLTNLVANAVKFTPEGEVLVSCSVEEHRGNTILTRIEIKDTGIGIPENKMNRLFKSFTQVDASSTRKFGGTGLGLIISKRLIEAMGGSISVKSTPGQGSTFTFSVLLGVSDRQTKTDNHPALKGKRAFVLDDNPTNLKIIKAQLSNAEVDVTLFQSPFALLDQIDSLDSYDFGILDMQIPKQDGIEVAHAIREVYSNKKLPLVLFSSIHELEEEQQKKMFDLYLKKPIRQTKLLNNLERLFKPGHEKEIAQKIQLPGTKIFKTDYEILLAEDNLINQRVAQQILQHLGITTDISINGKEAVERTKQKKYDLILMDMEMPVMDGLEATRIIKSHYETGQKPPIIIAMTANALPEDKERCFLAGMDDFLPKPVTIENMKRILKKWLEPV